MQLRSRSVCVWNPIPRFRRVPAPAYHHKAHRYPDDKFRKSAYPGLPSVPSDTALFRSFPDVLPCALRAPRSPGYAARSCRNGVHSCPGTHSARRSAIHRECRVRRYGYFPQSTPSAVRPQCRTARQMLAQAPLHNRILLQDNRSCRASHSRSFC